MPLPGPPMWLYLPPVSASRTGSAAAKGRVGCPDEGAQRSGCCAVAAAGDRRVHEGCPLGLGEVGHLLAGGRFGGGGVDDRDGSRCGQELGHGGFHDAGRGQGEHRIGGAGESSRLAVVVIPASARGGPGAVGGVEAGDVPAGPVEGGGHRSAHGAEANDGYAAVGAGVHEGTPEKGLRVWGGQGAGVLRVSRGRCPGLSTAAGCGGWRRGCVRGALPPCPRAGRRPGSLRR